MLLQQSVSPEAYLMKEVNNNPETAWLLHPTHRTATIELVKIGHEWLIFTHLFKQLLAIGIVDVFKETLNSCKYSPCLGDAEKQLAGAASVF